MYRLFFLKQAKSKKILNKNFILHKKNAQKHILVRVRRKSEKLQCKERSMYSVFAYHFHTLSYQQFAIKPSTLGRLFDSFFRKTGIRLLWLLSTIQSCQLSVHQHVLMLQRAMLRGVRRL